MSNTGIIDEEKTDLLDRLELYAGRLATIPEEKTVKEPFSEFFEKEAEFLTYILQLYKKLNEEDKNSVSIEELQERNKKLYEELGFHPLGIISGGFRKPDGEYEDICPYWRELI